MTATIRRIYTINWLSAIHMTLKMTSAQVVETSVIVNNNSFFFQNYTNLDDHTQQTNNKPNWIFRIKIYLTIFRQNFIWKDDKLIRKLFGQNKTSEIKRDQTFLVFMQNNLYSRCVNEVTFMSAFFRIYYLQVPAARHTDWDGFIATVEVGFITSWFSGRKKEPEWTTVGPMVGPAGEVAGFQCKPLITFKAGSIHKDRTVSGRL